MNKGWTESEAPYGVFRARAKAGYTSSSSNTSEVRTSINKPAGEPAGTTASVKSYVARGVGDGLMSDVRCLMPRLLRSVRPVPIIPLERMPVVRSSGLAIPFLAKHRQPTRPVEPSVNAFVVSQPLLASLCALAAPRHRSTSPPSCAQHHRRNAALAPLRVLAALRHRSSSPRHARSTIVHRRLAASAPLCSPDSKRGVCECLSQTRTSTAHLRVKQSEVEGEAASRATTQSVGLKEDSMFSFVSTARLGLDAGLLKTSSL